MDVRALRYFLTVAECGSYSRGSELLRISQPAVSRTIRNLEQELGRPVFRRHGHGVTMTEAGRLLFERSKVLLRQIEQTKAEIRAGGDAPSGMISIAVPPVAGQLFVPFLVERFSRDYPNVDLKIVGGFSGYIHEWLVRGTVDIACAHDPRPQRGFEVSPLVEEEVYVVGKRGSFPTEGDVVRTEDIAAYPLVLPSMSHASRHILEGLALSRNISLTIRAEVDDHSITRALLGKGLGFSLLTRGAVENEVRRGELEIKPLAPPIHWTLSLLSVQNKPKSDILVVFISTLKEVVAELVGSGFWPGRLLD